MSSWAASAVRSSWATTAARLPPALSPATARASLTAELGQVCQRPAGGGESVVDGGREGGLRCQPVGHRHHHGAGVAGDGARGVVVGLEVADHPAAAMEQHHRRQRRGVHVGPVDAGGQVAVGTRDVGVLDGADRYDVLGARPPTTSAAKESRAWGGVISCIGAPTDSRSWRTEAIWWSTGKESPLEEGVHAGLGASDEQLLDLAGCVLSGQRGRSTRSARCRRCAPGLPSAIWSALARLR